MDVKARLSTVLILLLSTGIFSDATAVGRAVGIKLDQTDDGLVIITYDLVETAEPVKVKLVGSDDGGKTNSLKTNSISGDVGETTPGKDKRIIWDAPKDYPGGIDELDIVLDLKVEELKPAADGPTYFVIPIKGAFGAEVEKDVVEQCLMEAERLGPDAVILEFDSPGGRISELFDLIDLLTPWAAKHPEIKLAAFIEKEAFSAAAILSMICKDIYMTPNAAAGAAMAINVSPGKVTAVDEKFSSAFRGKSRAAAEAGGHDPLLVEAMMDPDVELSLVKTEDGGTTIVLGNPSDQQKEEGKATLLIAKNKLLTLTPSEAVNCGLAKGIVNDYEELGKALGMTGWTEIARTGRELVKKHGDEISDNIAYFDSMVLTIEESIDKVQQASGYQLSPIAGNIWEVRTTIDDLEHLASQYDYLAQRLHSRFPGGMGKLKNQCDKALSDIKRYKKNRRR